MHRCEVKIQHAKGEPTPCGDHANKKIGNVWMCNYHYATLQHIEDYEQHGWLKSVTDYSNAKD